MYKIKQKPEDFLVEEIMDLDFDNEGRYAYYTLTKKNYATQKAVGKISRIFRIRSKYINFAGTKDKEAITKQFISISLGPKRNLEIVDIKLDYVGRGNNRLNLGTHLGNKFNIVVRNISKKPKKISKITNYFDEQRFGKSKLNHKIGKLLVQRKFEDAVKKIIETDKYFAEKIDDSKSYVNMLRKIPKRILRIYVHSYQSYVWNETAKLYSAKRNIKIPLVGYKTKLKNPQLKKIIDELLEKEKIKQEDFKISQMPELSSEGGERDLFVKVNNLKIGKLENDEINNGKKKCSVSFSLSKGAYATMVIKTMFS